MKARIAVEQMGCDNVDAAKQERDCMKSKWIVTFALALTLPACTLLAQNDGAQGQNPPPPSAGGPPDGGPAPGGRSHHHRPPPLPIIQVLDANHDGIISADEIANAAAALKTLDKNGDGQMTRDEYMPPRPPRPDDGGNTNTPPDGPPPGADDQNGQNHPPH